MALAAESFAGRLVAVLSRRSPAFRRPPNGAETSSTPKRAQGEGAKSDESTRVRPKAERFLLNPDIFLDIVSDQVLDSNALQAFRARAAEIPPRERMQMRTELQKARAEFQLADDCIGMLSEMQIMTLPTADRRGIRRGDARRNLILCASITERARGESSALSKSISSEMSSFADSLSLIITIIAARLRECSQELQGSRFLGNAPRLESVQEKMGAVYAISHITKSTLDEVTDNFSGADLRGLDLEAVNLSWLRWDEATEWPPDWVPQIRRISIEVSPGHWVVQPIEAEEEIDLLV